jgi:hypothetical protein
MVRHISSGSRQFINVARLICQELTGRIVGGEAEERSALEPTATTSKPHASDFISRCDSCRVDIPTLSAAPPKVVLPLQYVIWQ